MGTVNIFGVDFVFFFGRRFCRFVRHINILNSSFFSHVSSNMRCRARDVYTHDVQRAFVYLHRFSLISIVCTAMFYNYYVCPFNHAFSQTNPNRLRFYFLRSVAPNHKFIKKLFLRQVLKYTQYANYLHCSAMRSNLLCK